MEEAELVRAIEENAAELLMAMGAAGGGQQRDQAAVRWTIGGSPIDYHNAVVAADLGGADVDAVIAESLKLMRDRGVPGSWHVGPSMRPADLGERLVKAGFSAAGSEPGMAVDLTKLDESAAGRTAADGRGGSALPGGLVIERIGEGELDAWVGTLGKGFGEGVKEAEWVGSVYRRLGVGDPWRHYLGWLDGEPVATATVYLAAGVAGVYFVMTVPEARRRGIGAAITLAALQEARDSGSTHAVLGSSPAGRTVYESLGFRTYCTIELYELAVPAVDRRGASFPAED